MFAARRKPKRVAREEPVTAELEDEDTGPVVRRPGVPKTKSKLRLPIDIEEDAELQTTARPRVKHNNSATLPLFHADRADTAKPTYDKFALDQLREATPTTPKDLIPSEAEIREKKARRARLAKEKDAEDFIPLEDYDSDGEFKPQRMQVGSYLVPENYKDTRLTRDDEDFAEGFEEFVDDPGQVTMGKQGMLNQARKEREAIRQMINEAEGSEEDESDSDVERSRAYESAQTHHGMDGLAANSTQMREANRPKQPRETMQIPKLAVALSRLKEAVQKIELEKAKIHRRQADILRERADIKASQEHVQLSLEAAGKELETIRQKTE